MATKKQKTVTVQDRNGTDVEVAVGLDGKNPVSINNPSPKSLSEEDRKAQLAFLEDAETAPIVEVTKAPDNDSNIRVPFHP